MDKIVESMKIWRLKNEFWYKFSLRGHLWNVIFSMEEEFIVSNYIVHIHEDFDLM